MAFQFILWIPDTAWVPKGALAQRQIVLPSGEAVEADSTATAPAALPAGEIVAGAASGKSSDGLIPSAASSGDVVVNMDSKAEVAVASASASSAPTPLLSPELPPSSEDDSDDDDELADGAIMPSLKTLMSGSPDDLVKVRFAELAKSVFSEHVAFAQSSHERLVHDFHIVEASGPVGVFGTVTEDPVRKAVSMAPPRAVIKEPPKAEVSPSVPASDSLGASVAPAEAGADAGGRESPVGVPTSNAADTVEKAVSTVSAATSVSGVEKASGIMVFFRTLTGEADHVVALLAEQLGIGRDELPQCGTLSILPVELSKPKSVMEPPPPPDILDAESDLSHVDGGHVTRARTQEQRDALNEARRARVRARVLVDKLIEQISGGAALSFDFVALVSIASILAGVGLATNNAVVIVASMLVSPLMSPVLALTFGLFVCDSRLAFRGASSELVGLLLCVVVGFIVGLVFGPLVEFPEVTGGQWPTNEMRSRGTGIGLVVGVVVALASGCGVALGIAGNNVSGLVGVAISASLLPPIVNAGMLWSYALSLLWLTGDVANATRESWRTLVDLGGYSLALALVNIACIIVSATGMFWIKEVAPIAGKSLLFAGASQAIRSINRPLGPPDVTTPTPQQQPVSGNAPDERPGAQNTIRAAERRQGRPIGPDLAWQLVVERGWHLDPTAAAAAAATSNTGGSGEMVTRGSSSQSGERPAPRSSTMTFAGSHTRRRNVPAAWARPQRSVRALAMDPKRDISVMRRVSEEDESDVEDVTVTRRLELSDFAGQSMFNDEPAGVASALDSAIAHDMRQPRTGSGRTSLMDFLARFGDEPAAPPPAPPAPPLGSAASSPLHRHRRGGSSTGSAELPPLGATMTVMRHRKKDRKALSGMKWH
jgi:uncharacterized hydrophobic protein (TIGR00271 family)